MNFAIGGVPLSQARLAPARVAAAEHSENASMAIRVPKGFSYGRRLLRDQARSAEARPDAGRLGPAGHRRAASTRRTWSLPPRWTLDRSRTPSDRIRAVVINSGNANACTGERGLRRRRRKWPGWPPRPAGPKPDQALVLSTGVIGEFLPMDKIAQGIPAAAGKLGRDEASPGRRRPRHDDHRHGPQDGRPDA